MAFLLATWGAGGWGGGWGGFGCSGTSSSWMFAVLALFWASRGLKTYGGGGGGGALESEGMDLQAIFVVGSVWGRWFWS